MIRLYVDEDFEPGKCLELPKSELHYFKSVRRGKGDEILELFNRKGQVARASFKDKALKVSEVIEMEPARHRIRIALGLPDTSVAKKVLAAVSELGVEELIFFAAGRSQAAKKRLEKLEDWDKFSIESARQCGRARPLKISSLSLNKILDLCVKNRIVLDEVNSETGVYFDLGEPRDFLLLVGPEGGWTAEERSKIYESGFQSLHFPTPILKVETACTAACVWALMPSLLLNR
ncbi:MAG: hypothetical protein COV44_04910 [Deltaproteobacteria bacterium CG11_big_fil_rev_8_21_14_0_20_45_16]|nr:MAG: hypothetical protein COV44_04910 [Deltaproteobacteria bacterium CG11_big_fil_rev_8_21_14_0_20_45_16]